MLQHQRVFVSKSGQAQAGLLQSTVSGDWIHGELHCYRVLTPDSRIIRIIKVLREAILKITGPLLFKSSENFLFPPLIILRRIVKY